MMNSCIAHCHLLCVAKRVLMQYPHHFKKMGCNILIMLMLNLLNFLVDSVPNLDPSPQEVPPPMQDEQVVVS